LPSTKVYTEENLIAALKNREKDAFEYLYHNYKGALFTVVLQIVHDKDVASDVLQEAFIIAWKNIGKYETEKGRLFTWLYNVTRNCAINVTRSKNFKIQLQNDSIDNCVNYIDEKASDGININQIGLRKEVHKLREDYRNVLELAYFNGLTHEEIAKVLNIPVGTVKTRLRNALIELRKQFL
jgi:RNA polymerase sigma factor (sigma-70 family)